MSARQVLAELRARRWWRRRLRRPLADRLSGEDRQTIEEQFAYADPDPERAYTCTTIYELCKGDDPELLTMVLRNFAGALRRGEESIDIALLGATMKAIREHSSGVPAERDELMRCYDVAYEDNRTARASKRR